MAKPRTITIIDIRSDSVSGVLVEPFFDSAKKIYCSRLLDSSRAELPFQSELDHGRFFTDLANALKDVLADLFPAEHKGPDRLECFLSAPFYAAQTRTLKLTKPELVTVNRQLISDLTKKDAEKFVEKMPPLYREIVKDSHELIEHKIMQIKLNRYLTHLPYGKQAKEIEISHYLSVGSKKILTRLRELLANQSAVRQINFHSFPFIFYTFARDFLAADNILLLDLGGEVAEVSLVIGGILWETASFPLGHNFLVRQLAAATKTVPEEALSALKIYQQGGYDKASNENLARTIQRCQTEWQDNFKQALSALTERHLGADKLLAIGQPVIAPIFLDWIKRDSYRESLFTQHPLTTSLLTAEAIKEICPDRKVADFSSSLDSHLLLETIFNDRIMTLSHL